MADIAGVHFGPHTGSDSYLEIHSYSAVPRTDTVGTAVTMDVWIRTGHSWIRTYTGNLDYARQFSGTLGGAGIGTHLIKRHQNVSGDDTNAHYWYSFEGAGTGGDHPSTAQSPAGKLYYNTTYPDDPIYKFTIEFNIAYKTGAQSALLKVRTGNDTTTGVCTYTVPSGYTVNCESATTPSAPTNLKIDGSTSNQTVASMSGSKTLSWTAPSTAGTGSIATTYLIYYRYNGGSWNHKGSTTSTSYSLNLSDYGIGEGSNVSFSVRARKYTDYGTSTYSSASPTVTRAESPSTPSSCTVPSETKYQDNFTVSWSSASAGSGTVSYRLQWRRLPKGSSSWSSWSTVASGITGTSRSVNATSLYASTAPGDSFQFQVRAENSYGLVSGYRASGTTLMKGGIMRIRHSGVWREGTAYIRVGGVWREATSVYIRVAGTWRESI